MRFRDNLRPFDGFAGCVVFLMLACAVSSQEIPRSERQDLIQQARQSQRGSPVQQAIQNQAQQQQQQQQLSGQQQQQQQVPRPQEPASRPQQQQENVAQKSIADREQQQSRGSTGPVERDNDSAGEASGQDSDQTTTTKVTTGTHDTVYSDQRFASLFARRNQRRLSRPPPSEVPKAKPTLPSFIKSAPDLTQFSTTPSPPVSFAASNNNLALQRQPNQKSTRADLKSPASINAGQRTASRTQNTKVSTVAPVLPDKKRVSSVNSSNNPSDPSNIIAQARKRLLANNALQSSSQFRARQ